MRRQGAAVPGQRASASTIIEHRDNTSLPTTRSWLISEVAPGRATGRSKIPRLVCVRDLFRHAIFRIGGIGGVGRLRHACGGLIRRRPPSQLGVRNLHPAVRSRGAQDMEDRVIGCGSGFRQPAKIPSRYRCERVVLAKRPVQRVMLKALQHLASPIQRGDVPCIQHLHSLSSVRAFLAVSARASPACLTWLSVRVARRRRPACTSRRDDWRNVEESPACVEYSAPSSSRACPKRPLARQHVAPYAHIGPVDGGRHVTAEASSTRRPARPNELCQHTGCDQHLASGAVCAGHKVLVLEHELHRAGPHRRGRY